MRFHGRLVGSDRRTRPSAVAAGRLRDELHRDIAELRVRLEEIALRSEVHQRIGNADEVQATLVEQRQMLHQFERRLRHRIADAIVEREAEAVLGGAVIELQRSGADAGDFAPSPATPDQTSRFVRTVAAAAAAAMATMLMFSSQTTGLDPASAPSDGPARDGSRAAERDGITASGEESTGGDFLVADPGVTDTSSVRERLQRRLQAPRNGEAAQDDPAFFEELLTRIFGAVASVTTTTLTQLDDVRTATELPSLDQSLDELADEHLALDADAAEDGADEDAQLVTRDHETAEPTESPASTDEPVEQDTEPAQDGADGAADDPAQDGPDEADTDDTEDGFGGFNGGTSSGTSSGTSISGAGLPVWD